MDYKSRAWKKLRASILRADGYMDVIQKRYGRRVEASVVHHIYPAKDYPQYAFEPWNLISVSTQTHNKLHNRDNDELTAEGKALMKRTRIGVNWRKSNGQTDQRS